MLVHRETFQQVPVLFHLPSFPLHPIHQASWMLPTLRTCLFLERTQQASPTSFTSAHTTRTPPRFINSPQFTNDPNISSSSSTSLHGPLLQGHHRVRRGVVGWGWGFIFVISHRFVLSSNRRTSCRSTSFLREIQTQKDAKI